MSSQEILSVGIDIGTSTTQVIFSKLTMRDTAGFFAVPHVSIINKEIIYESSIYTTPLETQTRIDGEAVRNIVEKEFGLAGFSPADTGTGAVIITGESARKENAALVLDKLSGFAGEFVVSTAGPDLESMIAGKGSGAARYSEDYNTVVANLDIGGGTTNFGIFDGGTSSGAGCLDIGGRQIKLDDTGRITYVSPSAQAIARSVGVDLQTGIQADEMDLRRVCDQMAELLEDLLEGNASALLSEITTKGSSPLNSSKPIRAICFSGGVADYVYRPAAAYFQFGDIGELLGESIRNSRLFSKYKVIEANETIRATVVGAGTYTVDVSGSTINYNEAVLPLKNIPVLRLNMTEQQRCFAGDADLLRQKVSWFLQQSDSDTFLLAMRGQANPSYEAVKILARTIVTVLDQVLPREAPILVTLEHDMAKVLGQLIARMERGRAVVCVDAVKVEQNDYVDLGKPLMNGLVIPVIVKTLILG